MNVHNANLPDILGWCACLLMLATFCCQRPQPLRLFAVAANLVFIAYGLTAELAPVLALHLTLLPVNLYRLSGVLRGRHQSGERPKEFDHSMPASNQGHHLATYRAGLREFHRAGGLGRGESRGDIGLDLPAHQKKAKTAPGSLFSLRRNPSGRRVVEFLPQPPPSPPHHTS